MRGQKIQYCGRVLGGNGGTMEGGGGWKGAEEAGPGLYE